MKNGKSAGHDAISGEKLKYMSPNGIEFLTDLLNCYWENGKVPTDWAIGVVIAVDKKCGITLLSSVERQTSNLLKNNVVLREGEACRTRCKIQQ